MVASDPEECIQSGLENVHSASTSKYKHKVYVIRDFPPGCGRLGATISRSSEQAIRQVVYESVNPPLVSDWVDKVECEMGFLGDSELETLKVNEVSGLQKDLPQENVVTSENDVFPQTGVESYRGQSRGMKIVGNKYCTRGGVPVVRDFPPFCGINAPLLSKEELLKWRTSLKNKDINLAKSFNEEKPSEKTICTDAKEGIEAVQDVISLDSNPLRLSAGEIRSKRVEPASEKTRKQGSYDL